MPIQRYWAAQTHAVWILSLSSSTKKWAACNLQYIRTILQAEIHSISKRDVRKPKMSRIFSRPFEGVSQVTSMISQFKRVKSISLAREVGSVELTSNDAWLQPKRNTWVCRRIWITIPRRRTSMTSSRERYTSNKELFMAGSNWCQTSPAQLRDSVSNMRTIGGSTWAHSALHSSRLTSNFRLRLMGCLSRQSQTWMMMPKNSRSLTSTWSMRLHEWSILQWTKSCGTIWIIWLSQDWSCQVPSTSSLTVLKSTSIMWSVRWAKVLLILNTFNLHQGQVHVPL